MAGASAQGGEEPGDSVVREGRCRIGRRSGWEAHDSDRQRSGGRCRRFAGLRVRRRWSSESFQTLPVSAIARWPSTARRPGSKRSCGLGHTPSSGARWAAPAPGRIGQLRQSPAGRVGSPLRLRSMIAERPPQTTGKPDVRKAPCPLQPRSRRTAIARSDPGRSSKDARTDRTGQ